MRKKDLLAVLAVSLLCTTGTASVSASGAATTTPIQHVIIIVQENHSFDNYFGTYPTANGTLVNSVTSALPAVNGIPDSVCAPYEGSCLQLQHITGAPVNPVEGQTVYEHDYSRNATGFAESSGPQSMVYFDYHTIPAYWDYAEEYGLADNYFAAVLSQTTPNRLMLLSGDSPVPSDDPAPPYLPYSGSVMAQLDGAGVTWGYYDFINGSEKMPIYPLNYFSGMSASALGNVRNVSAFLSDLTSGAGLPEVSFVNALGSKALDEHPPADPTAGEQWVVSLVDKVMQSAYWGSTAIFITWDEGGGFYDNVVPPSEYSIDHGFQSPLLGVGERVPLIVISPYSIESHVSSTLMNHLSLIHFIDYNWNLPPLNSLVEGSNLPLDFFNFSQSPRPPVILSDTGPYSYNTYPVPLQSGAGGTVSTASQSGQNVQSSGSSQASQAAGSTALTGAGLWVTLAVPTLVVFVWVGALRLRPRARTNAEPVRGE